MSKKEQKILEETEKKQAELAEKRAANLRANLQKRKVQLRERKDK